MRAVVVSGPGVVALQDLAEPTPGVGEVVLEIASVGICGTDLHILDGDYIATYPIVPGHEYAGHIVAVGPGVEGLEVGQGVTADPNISCGRCDRCRHGLENLCRNAEAVGVTRNGAMAEFVAVPAPNCVVLPEELVAGASLVEPLSCAVHAVDVVGAKLAASVLVYGAGPMGLMLTSLVQAAGAAKVAVIDLNTDRLAIARSLGADEVGTDATVLTQPSEYDVVIDCTGAVAAIEAGVELTAPGGTFLQFGVAAASASARIRPEKILMEEITITGARAVKRSFERAAALYEKGVIDPGVFITHRYELEEYDEAIDAFKRGRGVKVQLEP